MSSFCANILSAKNVKAKPVIREELQKALFYKKAHLKC